MKKFEKTLENV